MMAEDEPYDIIPHKEIMELKKQVKELKQKSEGSSSQQLIDSMNSLTKSMDGMLNLFKEAAQELKSEGHEESQVADKIKPVNKKLDEIIDQNKTIAEGMIAISDMVKDFVNKQNHKQPQGMRRPAPQGPPGPQGAPKPQGPPSPPGQYSDFPPPKFQQGHGTEMPPPGFQQQGPKGQGPVAMPNVPFPDFEEQSSDEGGKKKKGLFGRLKK